ncbi:hypothetical protein ZYGR_0AD03940 [Zygosaccharomyces rouxii]|uniref:Potassium channel domain-containing protein n=1 Tax=Zygosaccharomyces rouxii TaxID=4956 RepID=A0A1Q3A6E0_ZYGRO|nr:hypothetical protein ZYGR_0AD03940 [Zygosaccharomyces rouxii]
MKNRTKEKIWQNDTDNFALEEFLGYNNERVGLINENLGSKAFIWWFVVSCYFPIITACMGPIANTISVACLVEKWRYYGPDLDRIDYGPPAIFVVNILSLIVGFLSNFVLVLHFIGRLSYKKSQIINIFGWSIAATMLLVDVCVFAARDTGNGRHKTIGFWYAVATTVLYYGCTFTLLVHFIGFCLGKYPPKFNLMKNERTLMLFTLFFSILLIWGGGMFSRILHVTFGSALYFSTVSVLTVGLGDITPNDVATKILIMVFSFLGVVTLGLILAMTRSIIQESAGSTFFVHWVEVSRLATLDNIRKHDTKLTRREAYDVMMNIRRRAKRRQSFFSIIATMLVYVAFWNLGALVFKFAENWSYFNAMYFCFLCLITIGYGDFAPKTGAGRAFFVCWSLAAVPLMSAILSTVGESLFDLAKSADLTISKKLNLFRGFSPFVSLENRALNKIFTTSDASRNNRGDNEYYNVGNNDDSQDDDDDDNDDSQEGDDFDDTDVFDRGTLMSKLEDSPSDSGWESFHVSERTSHPSLYSFRSKLEKLPMLTQAMRKFRSISRKNKDYNLNYKQWNKLLQLYATPENVKRVTDSRFWLSDDSPLRFPLNEPNFAVAKIFAKMESFLEELLHNSLESPPDYSIPNVSNLSPIPRDSKSLRSRRRASSI